VLWCFLTPVRSAHSWPGLQFHPKTMGCSSSTPLPPQPHATSAGMLGAIGAPAEPDTRELALSSALDVLGSGGDGAAPPSAAAPAAAAPAAAPSVSERGANALEAAAVAARRASGRGSSGAGGGADAVWDRASSLSGAPRNTSVDYGASFRKVGYLNKCGHVRKNWKRRFLTLTADCLRWYGAEGDLIAAAGKARKKAKGTVVLRNELYERLSVRPLDDARFGRRHCFVVTYLSGEYELNLQAASDEERQKWMDAILAAATSLSSAEPGAASGETAEDTSSNQ